MIRLEPTNLPSRRQAVDPATLAIAAEIVNKVRSRGMAAVEEYSTRFGDGSGNLVALRDELFAAYLAISAEDRAVLDRTAARIRSFAEAQRACITDLQVATECGFAGHEIAPVERAGCYAPGGRFPLPSSVLMTAVTARAAGVAEVWVASPKPTPVTLAAAYVSGADGLLKAGGAQAIAALAYGAEPIPACDAVVGPGNKFVTAAKKLISGDVAIDMLAGPSELVVLAGPNSNPDLIAADLLAQAEHDPDAAAFLVTWCPDLVPQVESKITEQQLADREYGPIYAVLTGNEDEAADTCDRLAPEHLQIAGDVKARPTQYGALFIGDSAAEVFGDYGAGPNHTLPTGGTARSFAGLSVFTFLRIRTWMRGDSLSLQLREDTIALARMEGLESHARAAERRSVRSPGPIMRNA